MSMYVFPECPNPKVPKAGQPFYHSIDLQTRFNDVDVFGHLNNSVYLQFFDLGKVRYFTAVMGGEIDWHSVTVVVVNINCSFFSPAYFDEPLKVVTACSSISQHSFVLEQRILNPLTGDVKCICSTVMAGFDPKTATGAPIPEEWSAALREFEGMS